VDLNFRQTFASGVQWETAATAFGGNDTMGALLAWRGWSHGRQRSVFGETLPLPRLQGLNGGNFEDQQDGGTTPFTHDLDHRLGFAFHTSLTLPKKGVVKVTVVDNNGDRRLHSGQYAWKTKFAQVGAQWNFTEHFLILGEYMVGSSQMRQNFEVDIEFKSAYLLASYLANDWRYSVRYDNFSVHDRDSAPDDFNSDHGDSYTFALFYQPEKAWRVGAELLHINSRRNRLLAVGKLDNDDENQVSILVSYLFK
jgi:hypothetical protein